ncbi:trypsin-like serine protease [Coemansia reversa NRRL 1564]|uniref:Trypsin-like serine protease n=1 Tax=Coemansia reversa (strain ATCC 12441 / NRRL 1564) TaxID=763665 RepID=A0A2G5BBM9_COERN|nr:trypsin-like serine protease [Coemansia reversa NRRL 1564]|eukprot:PIA16415.1 trypsin-like serine protease [Coemansia reversa NRRL 1564]
MKFSTIALATVATAGSGVLGLDKRIVDGSAVTSSEAGSYSFVTSIIVDGRSGASVCTGALISPTVVLTSAKCVADPVSNKALAANKVVVGQGKITDVLSGESINLSKAASAGYAFPQAITVHPGYNSIAHTDNIAVLMLSQPLANVTSANVGVKLIKKPSTTANTAYTAIGWGLTSDEDESSYPKQLQQTSLAVGANSTCSDIWAPYGSLTNSLCLVPTKSSSNVCEGDGLLVHAASDKSVGLAGVLNLVATEDDVPTGKCTDEGVADYFTTFGNYVGWLTQITPLKESDFVSAASFSYGSAVADDDQESESDSSSDSDDESDVDPNTGRANLSFSSSTVLTAATAAAAAAFSVLF